MKQLPTPLPVDEALRQSRIDIKVPDNTHLTVGPFEAQYSHAFHLAEIKSFTDLHRLGFVREEIKEEQLLKAVHADDRVYREAAERQRLSGQDTHCSCEDKQNRDTVTIFRRHVQNQLIDLLQPYYRQSLTAEDLVIRQAYGQANMWVNRPPRYLVGLFVLNNIEVGDNATLTMTPTVQLLHANEITIGHNGHLKFASGSITVRCKVLNGPNPFKLSTLQVDKYVKGLSRETGRIAHERR
jgi:hypothetical protein